MIDTSINIDTLKKLYQYWDSSGEREFDIRMQLDRAREIINSYISQCGKTSRGMYNTFSIVIDIDDTMISLNDTVKKYDDGWFDASLEEIMIRTDYPAFQCTLDFINWCLTKNIRIFVLSSRRKKYEETTKKLLSNAGYENYTALILRDDDDHGTIQNYKISQRKALIDNGAHILINIGDQPSDLAGGYSDYEIKIPNPFYLIDDTI